MENKINEKTKKTLVVIACALFTLIIYLYMCMVVTPKDISNAGGPLYYRGMGFMSEPKNSIDVMIYGNSDVYSGFVPAKLFEKYGYTSYASGRANQTVGETVTLLKETLETQNPKLVILETDCFFTKEKRVKMDTGNILLAPFVYHSRWKEITPKDFVNIPNRKEINDNNKGFLPSKLAYNADTFGDYMKDTGKKPATIIEKNKKAIDSFVNTCKNRGINVLLLELPSPSSWNHSKHMAVKNLAEKHKVPFLDLNLPLEKYQIDFLKDFRDKGNHMNTVGASKATLYIGDYINVNYGKLLTDKRNEEQFQNWTTLIKE